MLDRAAIGVKDTRISSGSVKGCSGRTSGKTHQRRRIHASRELGRMEGGKQAGGLQGACDARGVLLGWFNPVLHVLLACARVPDVSVGCVRGAIWVAGSTVRAVVFKPLGVGCGAIIAMEKGAAGSGGRS